MDPKCASTGNTKKNCEWKSNTDQCNVELIYTGLLRKQKASLAVDGGRRWGQQVPLESKIT